MDLPMKTRAERWSSVLAALLERADHPSTPQPEADLARGKAIRLAAKYGIDLPVVDHQPQVIAVEIAPPAGHAEVHDYDPFAQGCTCRMYVPEKWLNFNPDRHLFGDTGKYPKYLNSYDLRETAERVPDRDCVIKAHQKEWEQLAAGQRKSLTRPV